MPSIIESSLAIEFPKNCTPGQVLAILRGLLLKDWNWDHFFWDLNELRRLVTDWPEEFNTLYLSRFLTAHAAHLVLTHNFTYARHEEVMAGIARRRIQIVAIYFRMFGDLVKKHAHLFQRVANAPGDERLFQMGIEQMDQKFLHVIEHACICRERAFKLYERSLSDWLDHTAIPAPFKVPVQTKTCRWFREVHPSASELQHKMLTEGRHLFFQEPIRPPSPVELDLEKLCPPFSPDQRFRLRYGRKTIGYAKAMTNPDKQTLYVICADRTMRLHTTNGDITCARPVEIMMDYDDPENPDHYRVRFDNGRMDVFLITIRPHTAPELPLLQSASTTHLLAASNEPTVSHDFSSIRIPGKAEINLKKCDKIRSVLWFIHRQLAADKTQEFLFKEMQAKYNHRFAAACKWNTRFREDLFKGREELFDALFETLDRATGSYRIRYRVEPPAPR